MDEMSIIVAQGERLLTYSLISKLQRAKDWCKKSNQNSALFGHFKNLGEGWSKCSSELTTFNIRPNLLYTPCFKK